MTINQNLLKRSLVINVEDGVNADGSTRTKSRTYSEIKEDSAVESLYEAGNALASLMANNMVKRSTLPRRDARVRSPRA